MGRKRDKHFSVRLTTDELKYLDQKVDKSGLSREAYIRKLIFDSEIKTAPSLDYFEMKRELSYIGNNLNQIARVANGTHNINSCFYNENVKMLENFFVKITNIIE